MEWSGLPCLVWAFQMTLPETSNVSKGSSPQRQFLGVGLPRESRLTVRWESMGRIRRRDLDASNAGLPASVD